MRELRLYLNPDAPLSFVDAGVRPAEAPNSRPWIVNAGDLTLNARIGTYRSAFSDPNASMTVQLDNTGAQASSLLGQPLRVVGEIYDDGVLELSGLVQTIQYGTTVGVEIGA